MKIIRVNKHNYKLLFDTFSKRKDFKVNDRISFYEIEEIEEWTKKPKDNLLYAVTYENRLIAFCFCKIISNHWALIDNFYVEPLFRNKKIGKKLQDFIELKLKNLKIKYVSRVTRSNNIKMHRFLNKTGYSKRDSYIWYDKFL